MKRCLCILLASTFSAVALGDNDGPSIDATVVAVVTGGHWQSDTDSGYIRVVLQNLGWEHATYRAIAQWIAEPTERGPSKVKWSATLVSDCLCSFSIPVVAEAPDGVSITLTGENHIGGAVRCTFVLGSHGEVTKADKC